MGCTPCTINKGGRTHSLWLADGGYLSVVGVLPELCTLSQDIVMTDLTGQIAVARTSGSQHIPALKRPSEDQDLVPQASCRSSSATLSAQPSEPCQRPSKWTRRACDSRLMLVTRRSLSSAVLHCPATKLYSLFTLPTSPFILSVLLLRILAISFPILIHQYYFPPLPF